MAEYLIQDSTLTSIGNEIRTLRSSSSKMTPATMTSNLKSANTEVNNQTTIMNQILAALETKGDGGLNFKVVGGDTAPSNPEENTIWINTSTPIISWEFSATQPIASSGKVWICVGASSFIELNLLKENSAKIYPIYAKQYVSGAWVAKTAKSWQNGGWVNWAVAPTNGLIAEYTFNNFYGNVIQDTGPNSYNLTNKNVTQDSGVIEKAAYFSGNSRAVANSSIIPSGMSGFSGLTISFWLKTQIHTKWQVIMGTHNNTGGLYMAIESNTGDFRCTTGQSNFENMEFNDSRLTDGKWHHICMIFNYTTGIVQVWIDCAVVHEHPCTKFTNNAKNFCLGENPASESVYEPLIGSLDQVRLYNRALSDDEVATLWNGGIGC